MIQFRYNSYHKLLTGIVIIIWTIFHFTGENESGKKYENGQLKKTGGFSSGKNQGNWTWYYENGKKKMEGAFKSGKRNGIWITWDKNGHKITQGNYESDKLNGEFIKWDVKENMVEHSIYQDDKVIQKLSLKSSITGTD